MLRDLKNIKSILEDYFNNSYEYDYKTDYKETFLHNQTGRTEHNTFYINPNTIPYIPPTTVINNYTSANQCIPTQGKPCLVPCTRQSREEKTQEEKKEVTREEIVVGGIVFAGVGLAATYFLTKDEYIKFYLSKIDENMKLLSNYYNEDIKIIVDNYNEWKILHEKRTLNVCKAKMIGSGSLLSSIGGYIIYSNFILCSGLVGGTACGCYLLFKYLTNSTRQESQCYNSMMESINKLINKLDETHTKPSAPDAPPPYSS